MRRKTGREARLAQIAEDHKSSANHLRGQWRAEYTKLSAIAELHMPYVRAPGGHAIDMPTKLLGNSSPQARVILWCGGCNKPWPCKTYQLACGCPPFTVEFVKTEEARP